MRSLVGAIVASVLSALPARAFDTAMIGVWGPTRQACETKDESVFRVTPKRILGYEWLCDVQQATQTSEGWQTHMACAVEGTEYTATAHWRLAADGRLLHIADGQTCPYVRCNDADYPPDYP